MVSPENSPAAIVVGQNVTLKADPPQTIDAGTWNFESIQILFWFHENNITNPEYKSRISFNLSDGSLTITSLEVQDSGDYALNGARPTFHRKLTLSVQGETKCFLSSVLVSFHPPVSKQLILTVAKPSHQN